MRMPFFVGCALLFSACQQSPTGAWVAAPTPAQAVERHEAVRVDPNTRATWVQLHAAQLAGEGDPAARPAPSPATAVPADEQSLRARLAHAPLPGAVTLPAAETGVTRGAP